MSELLPIWDKSELILKGFGHGRRLVVTAPTGSGKSTQLPQMILDSSETEGQIVVLEPRRIAARMLARRVASERGSSVGEEVGYSVRFDNKTSRQTKIAYVTEGLLLRRLLSEPELNGVSTLIFDEFHERNLDADLALALAKQLSESLRPDLGIVVTSATIPPSPIMKFLGNCPLIELSGRSFPVEISYSGTCPRDAICTSAANQVIELAPRSQGDFLVFMPGAYEIRKTLSELQGSPALRDFDLLPLYGDLSPDRQDAAVLPSSRRKVVVATNVAETSLTIDGVRVVIDSGLAKKSSFDSTRGINSILPEPISLASADQRAGRAGRTAPGLCIRLWSEKQQSNRQESEIPEVLRVDLSQTVLSLLCAGISCRELSWLEPPEERALAKAESLLKDLGAVDSNGKPTETGQAMAAYPLHPRHARALCEAIDRDCSYPVALALSLAQDRSILLPTRDKDVLTRRDELFDVANEPFESDFLYLLRAWAYASERNFDPSPCRVLGIHAGRCRQADKLACRLLAITGVKTQRDLTFDSIDFTKSILSAFPEHVGKRRNRGTLVYSLSNGKNGELRRRSMARDAEFLVTAELEEIELRGQVGLVLGLATEIREEWLSELFPNAVTHQIETYFDQDSRTAVSRRSTKFRELLLSEKDEGEPSPEDAAAAIAEEILAGRLRPKKWDAKAERLVARINFAAKHCPQLEVEPIEDEAKRVLFQQFCYGEKTWRPLRNKEILPLLESWLSPEQTAALPSLVPEEIPLPNKKRPARLRYDSDGETTLSATIQDFYDLMETPTIAEGRYLLRLEILAPNRRPVQVTRDIKGFWQDSYPEVKRELAGRYPKHEWR